MNRRESRPQDHRWKLAAALLGIAAFVVAAIALNVAEIDAPWNLVLYMAAAAFVLVSGTLWLVPSRRSARRTS